MKRENDFEQIARGRETSFLEDFWMLLHEKKKYWLMPLVILLLLFGMFVFLSGTAAAPFIYTIF